jgi:ABC-2 type transport system permease protein
LRRTSHSSTSYARGGFRHELAAALRGSRPLRAKRLASEGGMSMYWRLAVKSFQKHLAYRAANVAGIATNGFFGAVYVLVYTALFSERAEVAGLTLSDTITYAIVAQSLLMAMSAFGNRELSDAIVKGTIAVDLARPVDFYAYWAALDLGRGVYYLIFRGVPTFVVGALLFGVRWPPSVGVFLLFLGTVAFGMVISFAFRFITSSLAFWTTDARGLIYLTNTVIMFFSGFIVPLNFFPPPLQAVANALPFRALAQLPINVYLGKLTLSEMLPTLFGLLAWLLVLVILGRVTLARMVRRVTLAGG